MTAGLPSLMAHQDLVDLVLSLFCAWRLRLLRWYLTMNLTKMETEKRGPRRGQKYIDREVQHVFSEHLSGALCTLGTAQGLCGS